MKNWFKKQKYKLLIALCSILSIFTLFLGISKTYAYTTNQWSYTFDKNSVVDSSGYRATITTYDNYIDIDLNNRDYYNSTTIDFPTLSGITFNNESYFLMNYELYVSLDSGTTYQTLTNYVNSNVSITIYGYPTSTGNVNTRLFSLTCALKSYATNYQTTISQTYRNGVNTYTNLNLRNLFTDFSNNVPTSALMRFRIYNIDYVSPQDIGLQQYYETYYSQIEDNYNTLLNNYNNLQDNYDTLESNYNTLESNYNDLSDNYNNLQDNYDDLENDYNSLESSYESLSFEYNDLQSQYDTLENALSNLPNYNGMQSFIDSFNGATFELYGYAGISGKIENSPTYTLSNFNNSNFNLSRDTDSFYTWIQNNINTYGGFDLYITLNVPYTTSLSCSFSNVNYTHGVSIYSDVNGLAVASYDDSNNKTAVLINENNNYSIVMLNISITQQDFDFVLSSNINGDQYMNGYNNGYNQSLIEWNSELNTARNTIESQRNTIRTLQQQLNTANQYDLNKLMWTIASTPFESFKQIWNVNFFGVNISTMITGFITGIIVLWIIKKFFL